MRSLAVQELREVAFLGSFLALASTDPNHNSYNSVFKLPAESIQKLGINF